MAEAKYPNPSFWRYKDHMDWKAQGENLKEVGAIIADMLKEADWAAWRGRRKQSWKDFGRRVADEARAIAGMSNEERKELLLHGEKRLGKLYQANRMATVRREWRGVADTGYDFYRWLKMWGMLLATFSKDLVPALNATFYYRWMMSYMCCVSFLDKNTLGQRGSALRMSHMLIYDIFRYVAENLVFLAKCDRRNGNCEGLNKKVVLFDEMTMGQIMAGFPDFARYPVSAPARVSRLRSRPAHLRAVYRRGRELRPAVRHLPRAVLRVRRDRHRRAAAYGRVLHLELHALRRLDHGVVVFEAALPRFAGVPSDVPGAL